MDESTRSGATSVDGLRWWCYWPILMVRCATCCSPLCLCQANRPNRYVNIIDDAFGYYIENYVRQQTCHVHVPRTCSHSTMNLESCCCYVPGYLVWVHHRYLGFYLVFAYAVLVLTFLSGTAGTQASPDPRVSGYFTY